MLLIEVEAGDTGDEVTDVTTVVPMFVALPREGAAPATCSHEGLLSEMLAHPLRVDWRSRPVHYRHRHEH